MKLVTSRDIQAALLSKGFSCRSWAIEHQFNPRTVQKCIQRFAPDQNRVVTGKEYKKILDKLSETLGVQLGGNDA